MNNEFQRNDNSNRNKVKIVIITILVMIVLGLAAFLVWDKIISKDNDITNNENNNQNNSNNVSEVITLDINSSTVKNLVYPYENNEILSDLTSFNVETTDKGLLRDLAWKMIEDGYEYGSIDDANERSLVEKDLIFCLGAFDYTDGSTDCSYVTSSVMKKNFVRVFGPDIAYTDGKGTKFYYDLTSSRYWANLNSFEGDGPISYGSRIYKAEQKDDEIYVYIAPCLIYYNNEDNLKYVYQYGYNIDIEYLNKDDALATYDSTYNGSDEYKDELNKIIDKLISENKLEKYYKFTFKKQSDGKYYIHSGEWL